MESTWRLALNDLAGLRGKVMERLKLRAIATEEDLHHSSAVLQHVLKMGTGDVAAARGQLAGHIGVTAWGGLILLRSQSADARDAVAGEDYSGSGESDPEEHVEVESRLDHDLSRFEMVQLPAAAAFNDDEARAARLEEENLTLRDRLFLVKRDMTDLRCRLLAIEELCRDLAVEQLCRDRRHHRDGYVVRQPHGERRRPRRHVDDARPASLACRHRYTPCMRQAHGPATYLYTKKCGRSQTLSSKSTNSTNERAMQLMEHLATACKEMGKAWAERWARLGAMQLLNAEASQPHTDTRMTVKNSPLKTTEQQPKLQNKSTRTRNEGTTNAVQGSFDENCAKARTRLKQSQTWEEMPVPLGFSDRFSSACKHDTIEISTPSACEFSANELLPKFLLKNLAIERTGL
ncbi:hypothetical protein EJB05_09185, partial [Eragrostis curvula]